MTADQKAKVRFILAAPLVVLMMVGIPFQALAQLDFARFIAGTIIFALMAIGLRHWYRKVFVPPEPETPPETEPEYVPLDREPRSYGEYVHDLYGRKK